MHVNEFSSFRCVCLYKNQLVLEGESGVDRLISNASFSSDLCVPVCRCVCMKRIFVGMGLCGNVRVKHGNSSPLSCLPVFLQNAVTSVCQYTQPIKHFVAFVWDFALGHTPLMFSLVLIRSAISDVWGPPGVSSQGANEGIDSASPPPVPHTSELRHL